MLTNRRSLTCAAFLAIAAGCSTDGPQDEPKLIPVLDDRGRIVYRYESQDPGPEAPEAASDVTPPAVVVDDPEFRQRRLDERYVREMAEWRKNQQEQERLERQEALTQENESRRLRQDAARQERQSWQDYMAKDADRRRALERDSQARQQAETIRQQQETAGWQRIQRQQDTMSRSNRSANGGGSVDTRFSRPIDP